MRESRAKLQKRLEAMWNTRQEYSAHLDDALDAVLDVFDLRAKYPDIAPDYNSSRLSDRRVTPGRETFRVDLLLAAKDATSAAAYKKIRGAK